MPKRFVGSYRTYTTNYDRVAASAELRDIICENAVLGVYPPSNLEAIDDMAAEHYEQTARSLVDALTNAPLDCAVTLLLDHSGSTRGDKACLIASTAGG